MLVASLHPLKKRQRPGVILDLNPCQSVPEGNFNAFSHLEPYKSDIILRVDSIKVIKLRLGY